MLESTIEEILGKDKITNPIFMGCFALDEIPKRPRYPSCFISNTKPRNHPGEHWVAFYYDKTGFCDFFDSYGQNPNKYYLKTYLDETSSNWTFNNKRIQGLSSYCGHYCVFYLLFRARNKSYIFFQKFFKNFRLNDFIIKKMLLSF